MTNLSAPPSKWHITLLILLTFLLFGHVPSIAQVGAEEAQIDSLKQVIATAEHDTVKIMAYMTWNELIYKIDQPGSIQLMDKVIRLCLKRLDQKEVSTTDREKYIFKRTVVASLHHTAFMYREQGDQKKSLKYLLEAIAFSEKFEMNFKLAELQYETCGHYLKDNIHGTALDYCQQSLQTAQITSDTLIMAKALEKIAMTYSYQGNNDNALENFKRSLVLFEVLGSPRRVVAILNEIGRIYEIKGSAANAIKYFSRSLQISQKHEDQRMISHSLNCIAYMYDDLGEFTKARDFFLQSFEIRKKGGSKQDMAGSLFNLGYIHTKLGAYQMALDYQKRSLALRKELGEPIWIAQSLNNIGSIYEKEGDYKTAVNYLEKSLQLNEETNGELIEPETLNLLAHVYKKQGYYKKAIVYSRKALAIARKQGALEEIGTSFYTQYQTHKLQNHPAIALQMFEAYIEVRDSLESEKNEREVIRQEYKYDYEKQALADSLQNAETQKLSMAQLTAQKAQNLQQRQQAMFGGGTLLFLLFGSGLFFYQRRNVLQARLQLEQKEALRLKELDQLKTQLYTNLTHEFRTPLTVILGMAEKIKSTPKRFAEEGANLIARNGNNLLRIINQLLDLSKLENHALKLQLQQSDIVAYLHYITDAFHSYASNKNLSIRFFSNHESLLMDYDQEQMKQVMTNLISNAIKFTSFGGDIRVNVLKEKDHLQIEIKDNGIGIPEEALPFIFDRFYQVDDSMTRAHEGTGIGLAHTKELVKLMEGEIEVESKLAEGTTFIIRLPIRNEAPFLASSTIADMEIIVPTTTAKEADAVTAKLTNLPTVLIIEDNPDVVVYLKSCLDKDYHLEVAYNGSIGIEMAIEKIPDLIISDVMMPGKDGFEVCNTLKLDERTSHIPIVLLTAKADISSKLDGLERGADAYLAKPFNPEELSIRLQKLLEGRKKMKKIFGQLYLPYSIKLGDAPLSDTIPPQIEDAFIKKMNSLLEENIQDESFALPELCRQLGMSRSQFFRKIKALTSMAPSDYIRTYRLQKAKYLLEHSDHNVTEVAYEVGFKNPSYFSSAFQKAFGLPPSALKK